MNASDCHTESNDIFAANPWPEGARAIILVDLDAFFASVEQLDHPEWRGLPVIVGGSPEARGVVSTASYEARRYGVHSAMPSAQAVKLCPEAIWVSGNYARYREMSARVMDIIRDVTPFVQQVSIDEAFADITPSAAFAEHPALVAADIQRRVFELGITCSIGLATSKSLAKIASEVDKPRGLTVVFPGSERSFVATMPVDAMSGIGDATARRLVDAGFQTLGDVWDASFERLQGVLGKVGCAIWERLHGKDRVDTSISLPKSVSHDVTFAHDLVTYESVEAEMLAILAEVCRRLRKTGLYAGTLSVKVHYDATRGRSAQTSLGQPCADEYRLKEDACALLRQLVGADVRVRLLSVGLSGLTSDAAVQPDTLFTAADVSSTSGKRRSTEELVRTKDLINERFGRGTVQAGRNRYSKAGLHRDE